MWENQCMHATVCLLRAGEPRWSGKAAKSGQFKGLIFEFGSTRLQHILTGDTTPHSPNVRASRLERLLVTFRLYSCTVPDLQTIQKGKNHLIHKVDPGPSISHTGSNITASRINYFYSFIYSLNFIRHDWITTIWTRNQNAGLIGSGKSGNVPLKSYYLYFKFKLDNQIISISNY